ncbi:hypothetical protein [uncultured Sphingomonas sp.]|uniref:hypothetical protein n=1 Tax=uncultured Sphingomonas sp. TaxID=158754 RepID=UPI0035CAAA1D
MSAYRPEFEAALRLFARASEAMKARGFPAPILVGGGAVELYSNSAVTTGDFDIVTPRQEEFEGELKQLGFTKPVGLGHTPLGWVHPELRLGFEIVSATVLNGMADRDRLVLIDLGEDGEVAIISVEDMIADRMGQYASGTAPEMLEQARQLFILHGDADLDYMDRRIRHESGGDYGVADLKA